MLNRIAKNIDKQKTGDVLFTARQNKETVTHL